MQFEYNNLIYNVQVNFSKKQVILLQQNLQAFFELETSSQDSHEDSFFWGITFFPFEGGKIRF